MNERDVQRRLEEVRGALRRHHAGVAPDAQFATRVSANVTAATSDLVGWAALRLLPGTLILVLMLSWLVLRNDGATTPAGPAPTEDLLNWVAAQSEELP